MENIKEKFIREKCTKNIAGEPIVACSSADWIYDFFEPYLSSLFEPLVMPKIAEILSDKIKDAYMGQQALQNGGLTEEQENFEFIINDVIIKTLTSLKEEISNFSA